MNTPIPPTLTPALIASGGPNTPTITIPNPPPALTALPPGSSIQATVSALQSGKQLQLTTAIGNLLAQANVTLKIDQTVTLQVLAQAPSAKGAALQITALLNNPQTAPLQGASVAAPGPTTTPINPANVTLTTGQSVIATVISPPQSGVSPSSAPLQTLTAPNATQAGQPTTTGQGNKPLHASPASTTSPTATTPSLTTPSQPQSTIMTHPPQAGALLKLTIVSVNATPSSPAVATPANLPSVGQTFAGQVVNATAAGQPTVQTPLGAITIQNAPPLAQGAEITLKLEAPPFQPSQTTIIGSGTEREGILRGHQWPALEELTASLGDRVSTIADRISPALTPRPDAKLGTSLLFLLSALKGGDLKSWIGETAMRELDRLRPDMMRRLGEDIRFIAGTDDADGRAARATTDWRSMPLPLFGEGMEQARLLVRRDGGDEAEDTGSSKDTRFVVDLTLTSIGRLQLDGLIDPGARRFDMLVRTTGALPPRFRQDILQIFAAANETIGMNGGLSFRATPDALIETATGPASDADGGLMI